MMKRATLIVAALGLLFGGAGRSRADFVYGTAQVSGGVMGNTGFAPVDDGPNYGFPASASASNTFSYGGDTGTGSGSAKVNLVELPGFQDGFTWQLQAQSTMSYNAPFESIVENVTSTATWQDVLFLSNTDPLLVGHTLRLNFRSTLFLSALGAGAEAGTSLFATGTNYTDPNNSQFVTQQVTTTLNSNGLFRSGWSSFQALGNGFYSGTFYLDIPIVPGQGYLAGQPGSFYYSVADSAGGPGGALVSATETAADPSGFLSITLPDVGNVTPESLGVSVSFQSGIVSPNLMSSATPEPSSLALLATATAFFAGYYRLRRRKVAAPAAA